MVKNFIKNFCFTKVFNKNFFSYNKKKFFLPQKEKIAATL